MRQRAVARRCALYLIFVLFCITFKICPRTLRMPLGLVERKRARKAQH